MRRDAARRRARVVGEAEAQRERRDGEQQDRGQRQQRRDDRALLEQAGVVRPALALGVVAVVHLAVAGDRVEPRTDADDEQHDRHDREDRLGRGGRDDDRAHEERDADDGGADLHAAAVAAVCHRARGEARHRGDGAVAEQREHRGQQPHRGEHDEQHGARRREGEAVEEADAHDEQAEQAR